MTWLCGHILAMVIVGLAMVIVGMVAAGRDQTRNGGMTIPNRWSNLSAGTMRCVNGTFFFGRSSSPYSHPVCQQPVGDKP